MRPGVQSIVVCNGQHPPCCCHHGPELGKGTASALFCVSWLRADTHLYAGAVSTNVGSQLLFSNGALFDATRGPVALPQVLRTNGLNAGYYRGDALIFSALPAFPENGGPVAFHAALGARLAVRVVSVEGPTGGSFGFWEGDGESDLGVLTFSAPVGTRDGEHRLVLSENLGEPGADPYGHIHGRQFTTRVEGMYVVGFQLIDLSTNGPGGGPLHAPSDILRMRFQAGPRIESLVREGDRLNVQFRSPPGISNAVEAARSVVGDAWSSVGNPVRGNNGLQSLTLTNLPPGDWFFRLRQLNNLP